MQLIVPLVALDQVRIKGLPLQVGLQREVRRVGQIQRRLRRRQITDTRFELSVGLRQIEQTYPLNLVFNSPQIGVDRIQQFLQLVEKLLLLALLTVFSPDSVTQRLEHLADAGAEHPQVGQGAVDGFQVHFRNFEAVFVQKAVKIFGKLV